MTLSMHAWYYGDPPHDITREWCLLDATLEEEESSQGSLCFSIRGDGTLTLFQHAGLFYWLGLELESPI